MYDIEIKIGKNELTNILSEYYHDKLSIPPESSGMISLKIDGTIIIFKLTSD